MCTEIEVTFLKERNISLDIYRLLCMFLITTIHIFGYSNLIAEIPWTHLNFYIVDFIKVLQLFSINGFIMISAYFLVDKTTTAKKLVSFEIQLLFYSIMIFIISLFVIKDDVRINSLKSFFPLLTNHYWYPVNYIILLIAAPWLNRIIRIFSKKELFLIIVFLSVLVSAFFQLNPFFDSITYIGYKSRSILWFFLLYIISAYIRLYGVKSPKKTGLGLFILSGIILGFFIIVNDGVFSITNKIPLIKTFFQHVDVLSYNSLLSLLLTVSSFIIFTNIKIENKALTKLFQIVTPALFGVYLIQEHRAIRDILWDLVSIKDWAQSYWLVLIIILIFICFLVCSVLLQAIYKALHKLFINKIEERIYNFYLNQKARVVKHF